MKKSTLIIFFIFTTFIGYSNMASPILEGYHSSSIISSRNFDILSEVIHIKIDKNFKNAKYKIIYEIKADTSGFLVPFLFIALEQNSTLKILWDGVPIQLSEIDFIQNEFPDSMFIPYSSVFSERSGNDKYGQLTVDWKFDNTQSLLSLNDMNYFKIDVTKGTHKIVIEYDANVWINQTTIINDYGFRYSLSPALHWKSFNSLEVFLDASECEKNFETNLGKPTKKLGEKIFYWKFNNLPSETICISHHPEISEFLKSFATIGPVVFLFISLILIFILHRFINKLYRIYNYEIRFSWVAIVFSFFPPIISYFVFMYSFDFFDSLIGLEASRNHGYTFLIFFTYPIFWLVYFACIQLSDIIIRDNERKRNDYHAPNK